MTKIAFLMDPLSSLNTKKDSTLAMINAAQKKGLEVFYLEQRDISYMNEYWPDRTATGTPRYWAWWDHNTIYVAPTPDLAYNVELGITRLPTRLSSTNTTSWLGNNAPAALLYASLAEAFKFLKGPPDMLQTYEQSYQRALQELVIEQQGRHRRDEYMQGALRTPLQSKNP